MSDQSVSTPAPSRWILGPLQDLLLFVATPVVILPAVLLALNSFESKEIQTLVLVFGSLGHHLPGMMRAYGDRALFRRFRTRFILAPLVLGGVVFAFALRGSDGIEPVVFVWAAWHALMQVYGFLRIYDAKVGAFAPRISRVDLAMVLAWFGGAIVLSDARVYQFQEVLVGMGVAPMGANSLGVLRAVIAVVLGGVTIAYFVSQVVPGHDRVRVNPIKHLLMFTTIGFWWFAHFLTQDVLLGLIMFEIFHDVQYLAIVWIFNRQRVRVDPNVGGFTRFVFRNSWGMMGVYLALVLAYGGLVPLSHGLGLGENGTHLIEAAVLTSTLLHYYFDGFIWKVRESSTRKALGLDGDSGRGDLRVPAHALKWLLFLVPCGILWAADGDNPAPALERARALANSTPGSAEAQARLGHELNLAGRHEESLPALKRSLEILPDNPLARRSLALAQLEVGRKAWLEGDRKRAARFLGEAYAEIPDIVKISSVRLASHRRSEGKLDEAASNLALALHLDPDFARAHLDLALVHRDARRFEQALKHATRAAELKPDDPQVEHLLRSLQER